MWSKMCLYLLTIMDITYKHCYFHIPMPHMIKTTIYPIDNLDVTTYYNYTRNLPLQDNAPITVVWWIHQVHVYIVKYVQRICQKTTVVRKMKVKLDVWMLNCILFLADLLQRIARSLSKTCASGNNEIQNKTHICI